jgi:hypothetical protein
VNAFFIFHLLQFFFNLVRFDIGQGFWGTSASVFELSRDSSFLAMGLPRPIELVSSRL